MENIPSPSAADFRQHYRKFVQPVLDAIPDDPSSDYELILRMQNENDPRMAKMAATQLYKRTALDLSRFAWRLARNMDDAQDLVNSTYAVFLSKIKNRTLPSEPFPVLAYMRKILYREYQRGLEKLYQGRRSPSAPEEGRPNGFTLVSTESLHKEGEDERLSIPGRDNTEEEVIDQLANQEIMAGLSDDDYLIVQMHRDGYTWSEIGQALVNRRSDAYVRSANPKDKATKRWTRVLKPLLEERAGMWE